jgi:hypothetical protein
MTKLTFLRKLEAAIKQYQETRVFKDIHCVSSAADAVWNNFSPDEIDSERIYALMCGSICTIAALAKRADGACDQIALFIGLEESWNSYEELCAELWEDKYARDLTYH